MTDVHNSTLQIEFCSTGENAVENDMRVSIRQLPSSDYGLFVWPSSILLAEFLWHHRDFFSGKRLVELGAGVGLAGIVAAKIGAVVTMTDRSEEPAILDNLRFNCAANHVEPSCNVVALTWGRFSAGTCADPHARDFDFLLAADCLYASRDFDAFFCTVAFLLTDPQAAGARSTVRRRILLTVFQERGSGFTLARAARKWGLCVSRPLRHPPYGSSHIVSGRQAGGGEELMLLRVALEGDDACAEAAGVWEEEEVRCIFVAPSHVARGASHAVTFASAL